MLVLVLTEAIQTIENQESASSIRQSLRLCDGSERSD